MLYVWLCGMCMFLVVHVLISVCVFAYFTVKTEVSSDSEQSSTSVLATLAALAEATAPINSASESLFIVSSILVPSSSSLTTLADLE